MPKNADFRTATAIAVSILAIVGVVVAPAGAQRELLPDTDVTPHAKEARGWTQVAGARYPNLDAGASSPAPAEVDFHAVSFRDRANGFAGGSACVEPAGNECAMRVPVIYRYTDRFGEGPLWREVFRGRDRGFVGAIAWRGDRAVAVGGTGRYPSREQPAGAPDPAGEARAWSWQEGRWAPAAVSAPDVERAGGLTAVACSPNPGEDECLAGGYRQLWSWDGRGFNRAWTDRSPAAEFERAETFRARVRSIQFVPGESPPVPIVAVTSGCCSSNATEDLPRLIYWDRVRWHAGPPVAACVGFAVCSDRRRQVERQTVPDSLFSVELVHNARTGDYMASYLATPGGPSPENGVPEPESRVFFASVPGSASSGFAGSPQGPTSVGSDAFIGDGSLVDQELDVRATGARFVAGAGDAPRPGADDGDYLLDWLVGEITASGRGAIYDTAAARVDLYTAGSFTYSCDARLACAPPTPSELTEDMRGGRLLEATSWRLHAVDAIGTSGEAWAVGERGAILHFGGSGEVAAAGGEPPAPRLGAPAEAELPDTGPYGSRRTPEVPAGVVPPLSARPLEDLDQFQAIPNGAVYGGMPASLRPEDVAEIVMSRDGAEGWAVGAAPDTPATPRVPNTTLYHYTQGRWRRCDLRPVPGVVPADPACAALEPLTRATDSSSSTTPVRLVAAARVPLENDGDPGNDDDFEVVAIGSLGRVGADAPAQPQPLVARYRAGRWEIDREQTRAVADTGLGLNDIAFAAPDDGWIVGRGLIDSGPPTVLHYDGSSWVDCGVAAVDRAACGNSAGRLPLDDLQPTPDNPRRLQLVSAGRRVYMFGVRSHGAPFPVILHREPGGEWEAEPGADPAFGPAPEADAAGYVHSIAVTQSADGEYEGWAAGRFGGENGQPFMRLHDGRWTPWDPGPVAREYLQGTASAGPGPGDRISRTWSIRGATTHALFADREGRLRSFVAPENRPVLGSDPDSELWDVAPTPFHTFVRRSHEWDRGIVRALAPDGQGGLWLAVRDGDVPQQRIHFYRYTDAAPRAVFEDAPHPVREPLTATTAGPDGSVWVATASDVVYRYDARTGWGRLRIPGWDPGRLTSRRSIARAVAVGPSGEGLVVGEGGRIARITPTGAALDVAAGAAAPLCSRNGGVPPCGTSRDLLAAAVAPDGSAIAAGEARALLWRPAGGEFRPMNPPPLGRTASISGVSMPVPDRAWVVSNTGTIAAGRLLAGEWTWEVESLMGDGLPITLGTDGGELPLRAIAVDSDGRGLAVGDEGLILERVGDAASERWRRRTGFKDDFTAVALSPAGFGHGALVGGELGVILTAVDGELEVARHGDRYDVLKGTGDAHATVGVALTASAEAGGADAWAAVQSEFHRADEPGQLLRYTEGSNAASVRPLPDAPAPRAGETAFAAFGGTACQFVPEEPCPELTGSNWAADVLTRRTVDEIARRANGVSGPAFAIFTGDATDAAGQRSEDFNTPIDESVVHRRWIASVVRPLARAGLPVFAAIGGKDLSRADVCDPLAIGYTRCTGTKSASTGPNLPWRWATRGMPAPWGAGAPAATGRFEFRPVPGSRPASDDLRIAAGSASAPTGGANTHYAFDVSPADAGGVAARVAVLDTSLRSLAASDPVQAPLEPAGGQLRWLSRVLDGRPPGTPGIVVSNTPTYSYGPGVGTDTLAEAAVLEDRLLRSHASVLVTGRLGWNGLYWVSDPGVHQPCPGGEYAPSPREDRVSPCEEPTPSAGPPAEADTLATVLAGTGAPAPPSGGGSALPVVIAAAAASKFGPAGNSDGPAGRGYWHGYTMVRVSADGDAAKTIVEQRPVFDWIVVSARDHVLRPGQRMRLRGEGREPITSDAPVRYDAIDSPAITHRYDLVEADGERPWQPRETGDGGYVPLDPSVATIDADTGLVRAGRGRQERVYAVAILSVGDKAATWPLVFEPARSFARMAAERVPARPAAAVPPVPGAPPAVQVLPTSPAQTYPPSPPPIAPPGFSSLGLSPPAVPTMPPLDTAPVRVTSPAPPPPPFPPAGGASATGLHVQAPVNPVAVVPTVVPPTPPPINPAPPGGSAARKEARQRQAATAKSEEGGGGELQEAGGDLADGPRGTGELQFSRLRRHPTSAVASSAPLPTARNPSPSGWVQTLTFGGGAGAAAFALAAAAAARSRRRPHTAQPAPSWSRARR